MAKVLINGLASSGKTTLTKDMKDSLVISCDGKEYPFNVPHVNVNEVNSAQELIDLINEKAKVYKDKFGSPPKTIIFDTISRVFEQLDISCNKRYSGFNIYSNLSKEVNQLNDYIENVLVKNGVNVVLISHVVFNPDTGRYDLIAKGSFAKMGGYLSVVDHAVFVEVKTNGKRTIHFKTSRFPCRSTLLDYPESKAIEEFDLQKWIDDINKQHLNNQEFKL